MSSRHMGVSRPPRSQDRPQRPGRELLIAQALSLALRALAARDREDLVEDRAPDLLDRGGVEDDAGIEIHVLFHSSIQRRGGRDLDARRGLAPVDGATALSL